VRLSETRQLAETADKIMPVESIAEGRLSTHISSRPMLVVTEAVTEGASFAYADLGHGDDN